MADNNKRPKADGKRVALTQDHERDYLLVRLRSSAFHLAEGHAAVMLAIHRLEAGFPAQSKRRANRKAKRL